MEPDSDSTTTGLLPMDDVPSENERLRLEIARLHGQIVALQERLSAQDAADEHHRVELDVARAEAADARLELKEAQVRVEEWRRLVAELRERQALADLQRDRAEQERAAVISILGRRARKQLDHLGHQPE